MLIPTADPTQGKPQVFFILPSLPTLFLCGLLALLLSWPTQGWSAAVPPAAAASQEVSQFPKDFDDCVRLALRQSPFFTKSTLEIEVRRLDEADSKADLFPSIFVVSRYYPSQPNNPSVTDPQNYYVAFTTGDYNPLVAYLSLKAKKLITQIARLAHLKVISTGIEQLGRLFLELSAANRLAELQKTVLEVAQENLRSAQERQRLGQLVPKEVEIISQEVAVAKAQQEALRAYQARIQEGLRKFLDLKPDQPLHLDLTQVRHQVLGDFDPAKASLEEAQKRDFEVRIKQLTQELQTWNITLAKMKFMPSFSLVVQTPDPVSSTINRGTFFSLGLNFPIFEGFKRVRNINRQKIVLKQFVSEEAMKAAELMQEWQKAEGDLNTAASELLVAQAKAKLTQLKERQAETFYRTGEMDFSAFMQARRERLEAELEVIRITRDYDLAALELRKLSGELVDRYVHEDRFTF
jgi:outer membrane protein TolC